MNTVPTMKKLAVITVILAVIVVTGAAADPGQMFRIEFTVYENHTFTYLEADTVNGSQYLPYREGDAFERYTFRFRDADHNVVHTEDVYVHFSDNAPFARYNFTRTDAPTMTSTHVQVPVVPEAVELQVLHDGDTLRTVNLVDRICTQEPDEECNPFCGRHGADPDCRGDGTLPLGLVLVLVAAGIIGGGIVLYRRRRRENERTRGRESRSRRRPRDRRRNRRRRR